MYLIVTVSGPDCGQDVCHGLGLADRDDVIIWTVGSLPDRCVQVSVYRHHDNGTSDTGWTSSINNLDSKLQRISPLLFNVQLLLFMH